MVEKRRVWKRIVFVPFLGDFLSINETTTMVVIPLVFVPFLGDFLSIIRHRERQRRQIRRVFVPFLGDFLSIFESVCV